MSSSLSLLHVWCRDPAIIRLLSLPLFYQLGVAAHKKRSSYFIETDGDAMWLIHMIPFHLWVYFQVCFVRSNRTLRS
ncbi:hypothetical protein BJ165DRAFT_1468662 [Panaeolus papilionaceus]|nr:hypothetical protein BJ165DRAFT_1468662 [Panaeolus papilionaceus]